MDYVGAAAILDKCWRKRWYWAEDKVTWFDFFRGPYGDGEHVATGYRKDDDSEAELRFKDSDVIFTGNLAMNLMSHGEKIN